MGEYATYRAVSPQALAEALAAAQPGPALGELVFVGDAAPGPVVDLTNTHAALVYVLVGADADPEDYDDPLVAAVLGHLEVATDSPTVNDPEWVVVIDRALSGFDRGMIAAHFDPGDMDAAGVEPGGFTADPGWVDTLQSSFEALTILYRDAASRGWAVLVDIG